MKFYFSLKCTSPMVLVVFYSILISLNIFRTVNCLKVKFTCFILTVDLHVWRTLFAQKSLSFMFSM